jgi:hypothetical protein
MQNIDFRDIAQLLSYSRTTNIDPLPVKAREGRWALYGGVHKIHTSSLPFKVLYLYAAATQEDIRNAAREFSQDETVHVVYPPSLERTIRGKTDIASVLNRATGVWSTREYLVSFIKDEIQTYLKKVTDQTPGDYIDPRVETPSGFAIKTPNPLLSFLRDPESERGTGKLGILLAEPGQGKTYMSRYLVSKISERDKNLVPLMVDSSQWHTMPIEDQRFLPKTIAHSFRHFGATIGWLEGHEDDFLNAMLKADVFRIVFDGFDEYILRNRGAVQPLEVLEALAELAQATGTRIIITSRTSFWNTSIAAAEIDTFLENTGSLLFTILPFDLEHAKKYFERRFSDESKRNEALKIYNILGRKNDGFVGRGFVLSLVADLADQGELSTRWAGEPNKAMVWLIEALCEREVLRQELQFTAHEQMTLLSTFAIEVAEGGVPNTELLELAINIVHPPLDSTSLQVIIEKLKSHPVLSKDPARDIWAFKHDQLRILLLAETIVDWPNDKIQRFIMKAKLDPGAWQDLGVTIVDILRSDLTEAQALERLETIIGSISAVQYSDPGPSIRNEEGCRLGGVISLTAVERFLPRGSSLKDRAVLLVKLCGKTSVKNQTFFGTIASFDFTGVTFENCRFERVAWANCKFDNTTIFLKCQIVGGVPPAQCEGLGSAQVLDSRLDPEAEAIFNSVRVREGKKKYALDDLRSDIHAVISKFIIRGGIGLKSVEASNLLKGPISASHYREEIIGTLATVVFEEHVISGNLRGYNIRKNAAESVKFYAANNVPTGPLREAFERLQAKLSL